MNRHESFPDLLRRAVAVVALACAASLSTIAAAKAADDGAGAAGTSPRFSLVSAPERPGWRFDAGLYMWVPAIQGTVEAKGRRATVDLTIKDLVELVFNQWRALDGGGHFEARHGRFELLGDVVGGYMKPRASTTIERRDRSLRVDARLSTHFVFAEFGLGYRAFEWVVPERSRPLSIGLLAGARYYHMNNEISVQSEGPIQNRSLSAEGALNWADPFVGLRWELPLLDSLAYDFRADIGGFGAGSELSYGIDTGLRWWPGSPEAATRPWLGLTYKLLAFDYEPSSTSSADMQLRGPTAAVGLDF